MKVLVSSRDLAVAAVMVMMVEMESMLQVMMLAKRTG